MTLTEALTWQNNSNTHENCTCDFGGINLKAFGMLKHHYLGIEPFSRADFVLDERTGTLNVTDKVHGLFIDVMEYLARACNFTYEVHLGFNTTGSALLKEYFL